MSDSGKVLVVGSTNVDLTVSVDRFPRPGETLHARGLTVGPGGKGANQALAAARSGANVEFVGAVGRDEHRNVALRLLSEAGVELTRVRSVDEPTGTAHITVDSSAENTILVAAGANGTVDAAAVEELGLLGDVVVMQGEIPRSGIEQTARQIADGGGRLVLNLAPVMEVGKAVVLAADPLVANEHEISLIAQMLHLDTSTPEAAVGALQEAGVRSIVLTLGARGSLVVEGDLTETIEAPTVKAVDTTGAGDAFTGALAAGLARGESLLDAARQASRFAAASVLRPGAQESYPVSGEELPSL